MQWMNGQFVGSMHSFHHVRIANSMCCVRMVFSTAFDCTVIVRNVRLLSCLICRYLALQSFSPLLLLGPNV